MKKRHKPTFVALDGEAIDDKYVLLGTSEEGKCLENKKGIKTIQALRWLWNLGTSKRYRNLHAVFVSFYFSYDVEMLLRDLPLKKKIILFKTGKVDYNEWALRYYKRKFFTIRQKTGRKLADKSGQSVATGNGITVFDVCGFFIGQGGFIKVLQSFDIEVPPEIIKGKAARSTFTWNDYETIKKYNQLECKLLVELMGKVYKLCEKINLIPTRWYGASALANLALRRWNVMEHSRRTTVEHTPEVFFDAITRAYFGGRIEAFKLGSFSSVFSYDINSAYPTAMVKLPRTRGNFWIQSDEWRKGFALWHVKWKFPATEKLGIFPYRMRDGSIKFPLQGEGFYWNPEVTLAKKLYPKSLEIIGGWFLQDEDELTPLAEKIPSLYAQRQKYKAKGDLSQWIIKILLNSLYGKFAQKVGRADFKNFVYAGWITSFTRAAMRSAVVGKEPHIIAFNTDGIFSKAKLPRIKKDSRELGEWEIKQYKKLTVIMSGMYLKEDSAGKKSSKNRGYAGFPDWQEVFKSLNAKRCKCGKRGGHLHVNLTTFVGFLLSFNFENEYGPHYLKFIPREKIVNPYNLTKRKYLLNEVKDWRTDHCESLPIKRLDGLSRPIKLTVELTEDDLYEILED